MDTAVSCKVYCRFSGAVLAGRTFPSVRIPRTCWRRRRDWEEQGVVAEQDGFFCRRRRQGEDAARALRGMRGRTEKKERGGKRRGMGGSGAACCATTRGEGRGEWREVLRLRRRGGGHGGVADGVTVDDELDAAVALAAFGGVIGSDGLVLAEAAGGNGRTGDALLGEKIADGIGAAFGELLIEILAADAVGVTFDLEREAGKIGRASWRDRV